MTPHEDREACIEPSYAAAFVGISNDLVGNEFASVGLSDAFLEVRPFLVAENVNAGTALSISAARSASSSWSISGQVPARSSKPLSLSIIESPFRRWDSREQALGENLEIRPLLGDNPACHVEYPSAAEERSDTKFYRYKFHNVHYVNRYIEVYQSLMAPETQAAPKLLLARCAGAESQRGAGRRAALPSTPDINCGVADVQEAPILDIQLVHAEFPKRTFGWGGIYPLRLEVIGPCGHDQPKATAQV
jgi:hypothetical protein